MRFTLRSLAFAIALTLFGAPGSPVMDTLPSTGTAFAGEDGPQIRRDVIETPTQIIIVDVSYIMVNGQLVIIGMEIVAILPKEDRQKED